MCSRPHLICVAGLVCQSGPAVAACPCDSWAWGDQVAAAAGAAAATDSAPAAAMTIALDRLSLTFRCRDKRTFSAARVTRCFHP
jgi:hypothetical protein